MLSPETLVTPVAWRNPAFLTRMALTVDHLSNGRLELGLGAGTSPEDDCTYSMTGIVPISDKERVNRFKEMVEIVDQLLTHQVSSYEGEHYQLKDTAMSPGPIQQPRPPLVLAALGPRMLKIAAQYADTWNSFGGFPGMPAAEAFRITKQRNEMINTYCAEIGRDPGDIRRSLLIFPSVMDDAFDSLHKFEDIVGSYCEIGISEFIFYYPNADQIPVFEKIAGEVIPNLKTTSS